MTEDKRKKQDSSVKKEEEENKNQKKQHEEQKEEENNQNSDDSINPFLEEDEMEDKKSFNQDSKKDNFSDEEDLKNPFSEDKKSFPEENKNQYDSQVSEHKPSESEIKASEKFGDKGEEFSSDVIEKEAGVKPQDVFQKQPQDVFQKQPQDVFQEQPQDVSQKQPQDVFQEPPSDIPQEPSSDIPQEPQPDIPQEQPSDIPQEPQPDIPQEPQPDIPQEPSPDIQEQSKNIKPDSQEVLEGETVDENIDLENTSGKMDEFKEEFWDILGQAGFTKKRIIYFLIILALGVLVILSFIFGWHNKIFSREKIEKPSVIEETEIIVEKDIVSTVEEDVVPIVDSQEDAIYSIVSSFIFGLEFKSEFEEIEVVPIGHFGSLAGVTSAYIFGFSDEIKGERFIQYLDILRRMQNIFQVDVYELMNLSLDRRRAINNHISLMERLLDKAELMVYEIDEKMEALEKEFSVFAENRNFYESSFFDSVESLQGEKSYEELELFIEFSQEASSIKARFNAYQFVRKMLVNSVNALDPRLRDITVNKEALIQGVRVFDVPGSDIEAIIRLAQ